MKKIPFYILMALTFVIEVVMCIVMLNKMNITLQDAVVVNECLHSVSEHYGDEASYSDALSYVLIDMEGNVMYQTDSNLSTSVNEAIKNNDTILDVIVEDKLVGRLLIHNATVDRMNAYRRDLRNMLVIMMVVQLFLAFSYALYLKKTILAPFEKLSSFAVRVASGNLDLPLELDRGHIFGSFTEAFDLMRSELKKAKLAEKKANDEKKEVIAKLSHDIKTPVASIKSSSEFGYEIAGDDNTKKLFNQINVKSDQITTLVDNLFNSSVNDVTEIAVSPMPYQGQLLLDMIRTADYKNRIVACNENSYDKIQPLDCMLYIDKLRMQQALDNIFMNSYKYADTNIEVETKLEEEYLVVSIRDFGEGVKKEELPLLKEKFKRGSNITEKEGAGLGLYLANFYIEKMNGRLTLANANPGFVATFYIRRCS